MAGQKIFPPQVVVLRGPSGSGKSTTAKLCVAALRAVGISNIALVEEDYFRHSVMGGTPNRDLLSALIQAAVLHCLDAGFTVVVEGLLNVQRPQFEKLFQNIEEKVAELRTGHNVKDSTTVSLLPVHGEAGIVPHSNPPCCSKVTYFYWNISQEETVKRHASRTKRFDFTTEEMLSWWSSACPMGTEKEEDHTLVKETDPLPTVALTVCRAAVPLQFRDPVFADKVLIEIQKLSQKEGLSS